MLILNIRDVICHLCEFDEVINDFFLNKNVVHAIQHSFYGLFMFYSTRYISNFKYLNEVCNLSKMSNVTSTTYIKVNLEKAVTGNNNICVNNEIYCIKKILFLSK